MSARRLLAPVLLVLGCSGGEADDDSTIDPGGPSDHADEVGSSSESNASEDSGSSAEASDNSEDDSDSSSSDATDSSDSSDTDAPLGFAFGPSQTSNVFSYDDLQLGDLDADGCADLVLAGSGAPPRLHIYAGACDGSFPGPAITHEITSFDAFVLGDLDGDGRADVIARGSGAPPRLEVYLAGLDFTLGPAITSEVFTYDSLWSTDVDGDGLADVLTYLSEGAQPTVLTWSGPGDGSLSEQVSSELIGFEFGAVGRVDADARGDLLIGSQGLTAQVARWTGQLDGSIAQSGPVQPLANLGRMTLGDLDGDGQADLLTDVPGNDWVVQLYANLGPSFVAEPQLFPGFGYVALRSADLDGDGRDDLILALAGQPPRVATWLSL